MFIYVYFALKLVIKMKGWSRSFVCRVAVRTEASIYGDTSRHIKERQNALWSELPEKKMEWFVRYTCVPNWKTCTENFQYKYMYRYDYIVEVERFYRNR